MGGGLPPPPRGGGGFPLYKRLTIPKVFFRFANPRLGRSPFFTARLIAPFGVQGVDRFFVYSGDVGKYDPSTIT